jgi:hypothetical protein
MFLMFIGSLLAGLRRAAAALRRAKAPPPIIQRLVPALQVFVGMNILFSFASYGLSQYDWYLAAGLTEVVTRLLAPSAAAATVAPSDGGRIVPAPLRPLASRL